MDRTVPFQSGNKEIEDIIVLKNNKGTEDNRVRKLDYSIQLSKLFYERFITDGEIMFSPPDVPGLYDAFGTDRFDDLYVGLNETSLFLKNSRSLGTHSGPPEEGAGLVVSTS